MGDMVELVTVKRADLEELALRAMFGDEMYMPLDPGDVATERDRAASRKRANAMIMENLGGWVQISE